MFFTTIHVFYYYYLVFLFLFLFLSRYLCTLWRALCSDIVFGSLNVQRLFSAVYNRVIFEKNPQRRRRVAHENGTCPEDCGRSFIIILNFKQNTNYIIVKLIVFNVGRLQDGRSELMNATGNTGCLFTTSSSSIPAHTLVRRHAASTIPSDFECLVRRQ